jgi:5-methylcytosine-specific restriction endonuclease McrA
MRSCRYLICVSRMFGCLGYRCRRVAASCANVPDRCAFDQGGSRPLDRRFSANASAHQGPPGRRLVEARAGHDRVRQPRLRLTGALAARPGFPRDTCGRLAQRSRCRICQSTRDRANPYMTRSWRQLSLMVVQRDGACVRCGSTWLLSAHHVIPRTEGGADAPENLVALCVRCHGRESAEERRSRRLN